MSDSIARVLTAIRSRRGENAAPRTLESKAESEAMLTQFKELFADSFCDEIGWFRKSAEPDRYVKYLENMLEVWINEAQRLDKLTSDLQWQLNVAYDEIAGDEL